MQYQKVEICGVNTAKLPVLKEQEKMDLIRRAKGGDRSARNEMIQGNLRLVLSVVQKFKGRGESLDDLFQVGCIGLMKAIDHFDDTLGLRFSTYGQPMIAGEIRRFLRDNNAVRFGILLTARCRRGKTCKKALEKSRQRHRLPRKLLYRNPP